MLPFFDEMLLTFSNRKSFLSSKKIERFIVFIVFLVITIVFFAYHIKTMDAISFIEVVGLWLGYGGINSVLIQKDKKIDKENAPQDEQVN